MASSNAGPITGSELISAIQGNQRVLLTRPQVAALLALQSQATDRPYDQPTGFQGTERFSAIQGGQAITLNGQDLAAYLAASGAPDPVPPSRQPTLLTGTERLLGAQSLSRIAFSIAEAVAIRDGAGPLPPLPIFSLLPSISPAGGQVGTAFTGNDGVILNGVVTSRRWLLGGTSISTGTTATPAVAGTLTYEVTATGLGGVTIQASSAVTIVSPTVFFDQAVVAVTEGAAGTTKSITLVARRSTSVGAVVAMATFNQGDTNAADYEGGVLPGNRSFSFADGSAVATATVTIAGDADVETDESFTYQLQPPSGYALGNPSSVTGTILNDDSAAGLMQFGRAAGYDAGNNGDYFVAASGSDSNAGTSAGAAFATVQRAVNAAIAAGPNKTISILNSDKFRESVLVSNANGLRIKSHGTGKPDLTGGLRLTGLTQLTSADQAVAGPNFASMYKTTLPTSAIEHTAYHALIATESDTPLTLAQRRRDVTELFCLGDYDTFYRSGGAAADDVSYTLRTVRSAPTARTRGNSANGSDALPSTTVSAVVAVNQGGNWNGSAFVGGTTYAAGTDYVLTGNSVSWAPGGAEPAAGSSYSVVFDYGVLHTISHPSVLGQYTDAQLAKMTVALHADPNVIASAKVASASGGVLTLEANDVEPDISSNGFKYALLNVLPAMQQGQFAALNDGSGTLTIYVWPYNNANIDLIDVAARKSVLTIQNSSNVVVEGVRISHVCTDNTNVPEVALLISGSTDVTVKQVELANGSHKARGYGMARNTGNTRCRFERVTFRKIQNNFGLFHSNSGFESRTIQCLFEDVMNSAMRVIGAQTLYADVYNRTVRGSKDAHVNFRNLYQGVDRAIIMGAQSPTNLADRPGIGYGTNQTAARILVLHTRLPLSTDGRGWYDQTNSVQPPTNPSENYMVNSFVTHDPARIAGANPYDGIALGSSLYAVNWTVLNSVSPGIGVKADSPGNPINNVGTITRKGNFLTRGTTADATETLLAGSLDTIFYDAANGNFNTVPGSPLLAAQGVSAESIIAQYEAWFPDLDLRRDFDGNPWNPADPGVGPWGKAWPVQADVTAPTLTGLGTTIAGSTATTTVTTNERGGTIRWVRVAGGDATPSGSQVAAGQNAAGGSALGSGVVTVTNPGAQTFDVVGTTGQTDKLAVVHRDRHGNISAVATIQLAFAGYTGTWVAFDRSRVIKRSGALTGAQTSTKTLLMAFSLTRTTFEGLSGGVFTSLPSSSNQVIDASTASGGGRMRVKLRNASNVVNGDTSTGMALQVADKQYMVLIRFLSEPAGPSRVMSVVTLDVATGLPVSPTFTNTIAVDEGLAPFSSVTSMTLANYTHMAERIMVWDDIAPDVTTATVQQKFVASGGGLVDPQAAISAYGQPLISLVGSAGLGGSAAAQGTALNNTGKSGTGFIVSA